MKSTGKESATDSAKAAKVTEEKKGRELGGRTSALIYSLICVFLWALIPVVSKLGQSDLDNHQFLFWSSLVSFFTLFSASTAAGKLKQFSEIGFSNFFRAVFAGFLGTYLYYILLYYGYANALGLEVLVLQYSWPLFVAFLSALILREKITSRRITAIILGFAGVAVVLTKGNLAAVHLSNSKASILVLAGAFAFALFSVLGKKTETDPYVLNTVYFLTALAASFFSMLYFSGFRLPSAATFYPVMINGILVNGISYVFWIKALRKAEASFAASIIFLTPVAAAGYLLLFFGEPPHPAYLAGLVLVVTGGTMSTWPHGNGDKRNLKQNERKK